MSVAIRGVRNAFRNKTRTTAIVAILAIAVGLALSMLLANLAVKDRLDSLEGSLDNSIVVNPAGAQGFEGGGEPLTTDQVDTVAALDDVESVSTTLAARISNSADSSSESDGGPQINIAGPGGSMSTGGDAGDTDLESAVDAGTLGQRFQGSEEITLPITLTGTDGNENAQGIPYNIVDGRTLDDGDTYSALLGVELAEVNELAVGDTFTAYDETFTVVGIFDLGTQFENAQVVAPLDTVAELADTPGEVSTIVAHIDSLEALDATATAITDALGDDAVDVALPQQNTQTAIDGLEGVDRVSLIGLILALICAAVILVFTMLMIVRERRREIGVLKAIGANNRRVITQFVSESVALVLIGAVVGLGLAVASSDAIADALVSTNVDTSTDAAGGGQVLGGGPQTQTFGGGPPGGGDNPAAEQLFGERPESVNDLVSTVTAEVGMDTLGYGLAAAIAIAIMGSAGPAWLIARVRPAEVLRGE